MSSCKVVKHVIEGKVYNSKLSFIPHTGCPILSTIRFCAPSILQMNNTYEH
jgi:hypothetical protein